MKIAFVCDTLGSGGAERVISILSNEFVNRGYNVSIVLLSKEAGDPFYKMNEGIELLYLAKDIQGKVGAIKKTRLLRKCLLDAKPDIVISFLSYVCIYTWMALRHTKIPYIVSERNDPNQRSRFKQLLLNLSFKKAVGCVLQTSDALDWYKKSVKNKLAVIHNPVDLDCVPESTSKRKNQILYVGRFTDQKNLFMLLDAFKIFVQNHGEYVLKMYGNGPLKDQIEAYAREIGLENKVIMLPSSNSWQKQEADSRLFVLPSKYEGMPNVLAEALCLGIPSVSTNCTIGGPNELKKIFSNELVLSDEITADSFAEAMEKGLSITSFAPAIPQELSVNTIVDQWIDFINKVMEKED